MSVNQKEAVFSAVQAFLSENNREHELDSGAINFSKEDRKTVIEMISIAAMNGEMSLRPDAQAKYSTVELMRGYVNGLLSNWLRKDTRLNGGGKYQPKNPGSRTGSTDEVVKNLKTLKSTLSDPTHLAAVDAELQKRFEEIRSSKVKTVPIDPSKLPESVRNLYIG